MCSFVHPITHVHRKCRWHFNGEEAAAVVAGPPLFLGSLPARQPEHFYALLPFRPSSLSKVLPWHARLAGHLL